MTVGELKELLEEFDDNADVCIGVQQTYGSNFAYHIDDIAKYDVNPFYDDSYRMVVITEGSQMGTVDFDGEDY